VKLKFTDFDPLAGCTADTTRILDYIREHPEVAFGLPLLGILAARILGDDLVGVEFYYDEGLFVVLLLRGDSKVSGVEVCHAIYKQLYDIVPRETLRYLTIDVEWVSDDG